MSLAAVNIPKYATVLNGGVAKLGDGASTVGATALGVDGIAADAKICYTAGAYGGMVESLIASTNDTAAVNVFIYVLDGSTVHPVGIVNVPLSSGNSGTVPAVDLINGLAGLPINSVYKKYIPLRPNLVLKVAVLAAMTTNKMLWVKSTGVDFVA
jgi:hypothetical protein